MNNKKERHLELANFLKTRRAKILPSQVGLPEGIRRRTPGLRREEVAQLSGIGLTWYTWLEQGRTINVSSQILESLANVLLLNKEEKKYLFTLAHQNIPTNILNIETHINKNIQNILDNLLLCPTYVVDQRWNIIAWNDIASLLFGNMNEKSHSERNIIWMMFVDSQYKNILVNSEYHAQNLIARFRATYIQYINDPWLLNFIDEIKKLSETFNFWWLQHDIQSMNEVNKIFIHPKFGKLEFECTSLTIGNHTNLKLFVHTPYNIDTKNKIKQLINIEC